jgi:hypothetical protein
MTHALGYRHCSVALVVFTAWPAHTTAKNMVVSRSSKIDGNLYDLLAPIEGASVLRFRPGWDYAPRSKSPLRHQGHSS